VLVQDELTSRRNIPYSFRVKYRSALLIALSAIALVSRMDATPIVDLTLNGSTGDFVTRGQNWHVVYDSPADQISAVAYGQGYFGVTLGTFGRLPMTLIVATGGYNAPVTVGSYFDSDSGIHSQALFAFGFDGNADSDVKTAFTINAIKTADPGPRLPYLPYSYSLEYLDVSFTQESFQNIPTYSGRIVFDANPDPTPTAAPEPGSVGLTAFTLAGIAIVAARARRRSTAV
jgi:hypothetical protein